jgi:hypothetical protein
MGQRWRVIMVDDARGGVEDDEAKHDGNVPHLLLVKRNSSEEKQRCDAVARTR